MDFPFKSTEFYCKKYFNNVEIAYQCITSNKKLSCNQFLTFEIDF